MCYSMKFSETKQLNLEQKRAVLQMWNKEYPVAFSYDSLSQFEEYLDGLLGQNHKLVLDNNDEVIAWYFDFIREKERWFAIIIDANAQGRGLGNQLMQRAKEANHQLNGWVIDQHHCVKMNGDLYHSPLEFYVKNGFVIDPNKRLEHKNIQMIKIIWDKHM